MSSVLNSSRSGLPSVMRGGQVDRWFTERWKIFIVIGTAVAGLVVRYTKRLGVYLGHMSAKCYVVAIEYSTALHSRIRLIDVSVGKVFQALAARWFS